jgi:large subunit ribosomal protein L29
MAKHTKAGELRLMQSEELQRRALEIREGLFNLRLAVRTGEEAETSKIEGNRRELARILTIERERKLGIERKTAAPQAQASKKEAAKAK